ncbi:hypothetical protein ES708_14078 [subsurface metagenome]
MEVKKYSLSYLCKYCGSEDITETEYGYVCRNCATDQGRKRFQSTTSYNNIRAQNFITLKTTMGNEREREQSNNRGKIAYLNKLNSMIPHPEETMQAAFNQTKTLLEKLGRPDKDISKILKKFNEIRPHFKKSKKFRNPEKLIPCVIYFYYKKNNIVIDQGTLLENSDLSNTELNAFRRGMENFWSKYQNRDRKKFVLNRIGGLITEKKLGTDLYFQSEKILDKFWDLIKDSKDDVIAGLVIGIAKIRSKREDIALGPICEFLRISQGTLQKSIQRKLFDLHGIENKEKGFKNKVEFLDEIGLFKGL